MQGKMHTFAIAFTIGGMLTLHTIADEAVLSSPKHGIVYNKTEGSHDDPYWRNPSSSLKPYSNDNSTPASALPSVATPFLTILWSNNPDFRTNRGGMIDGRMTASHGFAFNDLDTCSSDVYGGSCVDVDTAVQTWIQRMELLPDLGMKLNALAGTFVPTAIFASTGLDWIRSFSDRCAGPSLVNLNYYEHLKRFASHVGQVNTAYTVKSLGWTAYGFAEQCTRAMQNFFSQTSRYLEWLEHFMHCSHFGFFRALLSQIRPNATMLTREAELTDIGSQYLGDATAIVGNASESDAAQVAGVAGWAFLLVGVSFWILA